MPAVHLAGPRQPNRHQLSRVAHGFLHARFAFRVAVQEEDWVQTRQAMNIMEQDGMWWLYYAGTPYTHYDPRNTGNSAFGLAQIPVGRVISARCWRSEGTWTVGPLRLSGRDLVRNAAAFNSLRVSVLDEQGQPLLGYVSRAMRGNGLELPVGWSDGRDLSALKGQPVKLRFELNDADLFGFTCR